MTEEQFSDLFQDKKITNQQLQPGDRIEAAVAGISGENIFLDIGGKSEGVLDANELRDEHGEISVKPGDSVTVYLLAIRKGEMIFTTKVGSGQASLLELEEAFASGIPVTGRVAKEIKGGFEVQAGGQRCFCPYSRMDIRRIENPEDYLEKTFSFKIIEFGKKGKNIIVSARDILEEERARQKEVLRETLRENDLVKGTVTSIRDFGAFVDLGGVDGLIPISELAWGQVDKVTDVLSVGQQVEVTVKKLDWDKERISLSLKDTLENPWDKIEEKYPEGSIHQGTVARLVNFGAFVTLEPGIDGLVHISKLGAGRRINHPREVVEDGQPLTVRIAGLDLEKKKISLEPEDYTAKKPEKEIERENAEAWRPPKTKTLGTLGDLMRQQMKKKGK